MGIHLVPLVAAGAVGALLARGSKKSDKNDKGLLYNTAVNVTAGVLDFKDSIENDIENIREEAESKNNKKTVKVDIEG